MATVLTSLLIVPSGSIDSPIQIINCQRQKRSTFAWTTEILMVTRGAFSRLQFTGIISMWMARKKNPSESFFTWKTRAMKIISHPNHVLDLQADKQRRIGEVVIEVERRTLSEMSWLRYSLRDGKNAAKSFEVSRSQTHGWKIKTPRWEWIDGERGGREKTLIN